MEKIAPQIHVQEKTQYHTKENDVTVHFTVRSNDVAPPGHRYPTWIKFIEATNHIATVTPDAIFYSRKVLINSVIRPETGFQQEYRHLFKGDDKKSGKNYFQMN